MSKTLTEPLKVFVACSGLGRINRGYESFFQDCFTALSREPHIVMTLFHGGGESGGRNVRLLNLPREGRAACLLGRLLGRSGYFVESVTFFLSFIPYLLFGKPDVVYVSDVVLGNLIRFPQRMFGIRYKVLFNNNGPVLPLLLHRWDHIQQVSPENLKQAIAVGIPAAKQTLLPSAIAIAAKFRLCQGTERDALRLALDLPVDRQIVLSVGSLSKSRKRMDYLIREVAALAVPRPFLLLVGAQASDTAEIVGLGEALLSREGFAARTVEKSAVNDFYRAADVFALASMDEGFGLVYVEALAHGLPCLVHDYETARFVLGDCGVYGDLSRAGAFVELLTPMLASPQDPDAAQSRHAYAYSRLSWDNLKSQYVDLLFRCAQRPATSGQAESNAAEVRHASGMGRS